MISLLAWLFDGPKPQPAPVRLLQLRTNCPRCGDRHVWAGPLGELVELCCPCGAVTRLTFDPATGELVSLSVEASDGV